MVVHLVTNASLMNGPATFQGAVYQIHSLGKILPLVEWGFIFLPIIFHACLGVVIIRGGLPNSGTYKTTSNYRYTAQRATGMIAFLFIFWHVFHMHGWFHFDWWREGVAHRLGGAQLDPYAAATSLAEAMQASVIVPVLYAIGVLSCVFHLSNGIWTAGITWGVWTTPAAMGRASRVCLGFGVLLAVVATTALWAPLKQEVNAESKGVEYDMYQARLKLHAVTPDEHKEAEHLHVDPRTESPTAAREEGAFNDKSVQRETPTKPTS